MGSNPGRGPFVDPSSKQIESRLQAGAQAHLPHRLRRTGLNANSSYFEGANAWARVRQQRGLRSSRHSLGEVKRFRLQP